MKSLMILALSITSINVMAVTLQGQGLLTVGNCVNSTPDSGCVRPIQFTDAPTTTRPVTYAVHTQSGSGAEHFVVAVKTGQRVPVCLSGQTLDVTTDPVIIAKDIFPCGTYQ